MKLTNAELAFITRLLGHHIVGDTPRALYGLYNKLEEECKGRGIYYATRDPLKLTSEVYKHYPNRVVFEVVEFNWEDEK